MPTLTWLSAAACWAMVAAAPLAANEQPSKQSRSRVYTNEDLDRISAQRAETGVSSDPVHSSDRPAQPPRRRSGSSDGLDGEARDLEAGRAQLAATERIWRREAEAVRHRLLPLLERLASLRASLERQQNAAETARRRPSRQASREAADARTRSLQDRIAALEERIRSEQAMLEERARRAGALPGWLR